VTGSASIARRDRLWRIYRTFHLFGMKTDVRLLRIKPDVVFLGINRTYDSFCLLAVRVRYIWRTRGQISRQFGHGASAPQG